ncbi:MAG: 30S ribosomal protein S9 [Cyclonatronaceae bacterium]
MSQIQAIGRRKTSTARAYMKPGSGKVVVNNKPMEEYFPMQASQNLVMLPFVAAELENEFDVKITFRGGGHTGQAEACLLGIARAIVKHDPEKRPALKEYDLLTRDDRMVERKKYGQPKARKNFQFSKR